VVIKKGRDEIKWMVVRASHQDEELEERLGIGLHEMDLHHLSKDILA